MKTIWKYKIDPAFGMYAMPKGATLLHVAEQGGQLTAWAEVDRDAAEVKREIRVVGTGMQFDLPATARYIGTVLMAEGLFAGLVWHVYDCGEQEAASS